MAIETITVKELIEKLEKLDQTLPVWVSLPGFNCSPVADVKVKDAMVSDIDDISDEDLMEMSDEEWYNAQIEKVAMLELGG